MTVCHQDYRDVQLLINGQMHLLKAEDIDSSCKVTQCLVTDKDNLTMQMAKIEVKFTCVLLEHNLPIASSDHVVALFQSTFPDNKVAQYY